MKQTTYLLIILLFYSSTLLAKPCAVLLHGLARSSDSMTEIEQKLTVAGYFVANIDYPSTEHPIAVLAEMAVNAGLQRCNSHQARPLYFVTHSLGGILLRQFYTNHSPHEVKRVVMLGPPNQGSEVVDNMKDMPGFELINGPAGMQLGTREFDTPKTLGPVNFELGIIAGTQSVNLFLSNFLPNPDDGKVSVASAKVEGMCGFITMPVNHPFMMTDDEVIGEVSHFLRYGKFRGPTGTAYPVNTGSQASGFCTS